MGDDFFNGSFPFVDLENGGSVQRHRSPTSEPVLPKLDPDVKIIPGHGGLGDKPGLDSWYDILRGTVAIMNEAIQRGETLEQVKKNQTLVALSN